MLDFIRQPWAWYVAGIFLGAVVPALLLLGNKRLGISSSLRHICAACVPSGIPFFNYDWRKEAWNLFFVAGIFVGALSASVFLADPNAVVISSATVADLKAIGIKDFSGLMPADLFSFESLFTVKGWLFMVFGGFLVGFGTRYAGGCTSGHTIMGLASLQWPSLVATVCFMAGGFAMTHFILPFLLSI